MKKFIRFTRLSIFLIFSLVLFSNNVSYAQLGWYFQNSGTTQLLTCIRFLNSNTAWAVGWGSNILRTTNGGANWQQVPSGTSSSFQNTFFVNVNTGWVVGENGTIIKTTNAGTSWFTQYSPVSSRLMYTHFFNENTGWICGYSGVVLKTTNSGVNWISKTSGASYNLNCIYFINGTTGFIDGDNGTIRKTTNGGENWYNITTPLTYNLDKFFFINDYTGWVTGINGTVLKTTNGGNNWLFTYTGVFCWITAVHFFDIYTGYACGGDYSNQTSGIILKTINGGINWTSTTHPVVPWMSFISFISPDTGWCVGQNGTIMKTIDGGLALPAAPILNTPANNSTLNTMTPYLTWYSSGGATNYTVQISPDQNFSSITDSITTINTGYYIPSGKLTNGLSYYWRVKANNSMGSSPWSTTWKFTIQYIPQAPVLIYPANTSIIYTLIPNFDWENVIGASSYHIQVSLTSGFATLVDSATVSTSNYLIPFGKLLNMHTYFWRVKAKSGSTDSPWSSIWYFSIEVTNINQLSSSTPSDFKLYSNYPNPFNPATKIKFDLPKKSHTSLVVYDALGRAVQTLVNTELKEGTYEYAWDASKYNSGVYFVRIISDNFADTKKMMLIK
ncbi:MAG: T9SS type A sorting domain-containing protein [Ignavibacteriae bacterium]|nr:T9SS type A sorting domain-containing protein [Ignavibacteriota bacterium]